MKKKFPTPEARKKAIQALESFKAGRIDINELCRKAGKEFHKLFFEKLPNGNFRAFLVIQSTGWYYEHPFIEKYQNISKGEIPEGSTIFE
jgi:hypothetical protein